MSDTTKPNLGVCVPCTADNHTDCTGYTSSLGCKCSLTHTVSGVPEINVPIGYASWDEFNAAVAKWNTEHADDPPFAGEKETET